MIVIDWGHESDSELEVLTLTLLVFAVEVVSLEGDGEELEDVLELLVEPHVEELLISTCHCSSLLIRVYNESIDSCMANSLFTMVSNFLLISVSVFLSLALAGL